VNASILVNKTMQRNSSLLLSLCGMDAAKKKLEKARFCSFNTKFTSIL
jgi:hypothetical protein